MNKILRLTFVALLALVSNMGFAADKDVTIDIFHDGGETFWTEWNIYKLFKRW